MPNPDGSPTPEELGLVVPSRPVANVGPALPLPAPFSAAELAQATQPRPAPQGPSFTRPGETPEQAWMRQDAEVSRSEARQAALADRQRRYGIDRSATEAAIGQEPVPVNLDAALETQIETPQIQGVRYDGAGGALLPMSPEAAQQFASNHPELFAPNAQGQAAAVMGPNGPHVNRETLAALAGDPANNLSRVDYESTFAQLIGGAATATPQAPRGGPQTRVVQSGTIIDPAIQQELDGLNQDLGRMRQAAAVGQLTENDVRAQGAARFADLRRRQREQAQATSDARLADYERRMGDFEQAVRNVSDRRVDPEAYFGSGFGTRLAAGIGVVLGQLGSALGGGPNTAMEILERRINQNIQAQQANIDGARSGLQSQGQALQQFRQLMGDEQAAQSAARVAEWEAVNQALESQIARTRSPQILANAQALMLQTRIAQMQELARATGISWQRTSNQPVPGMPTAGAAPAQGAARRPSPRLAGAAGAAAPSLAPVPEMTAAQANLALSSGRLRRAPAGLESTIDGRNSDQVWSEFIPAEREAAVRAAIQSNGQLQRALRTLRAEFQNVDPTTPVASLLGGDSLSQESLGRVRGAILNAQAGLRASSGMGAPQQFEQEIMDNIVRDPVNLWSTDVTAGSLLGLMDTMNSQLQVTLEDAHLRPANTAARAPVPRAPR